MALLTDRMIELLDKETCPGLNEINMGTLLNDLDKSQNPSGVDDYYVNGNMKNAAGTASDDSLMNGFTWATAKRSLANALALSHARVAADFTGWAGRPRVIIKADAMEEDLVLLSQKTDIIGVGSYNQWMKAGIVGNHVPISSTGIGVRFYNIHFRPPAGGGDIFTLDSSQRGIEFINCTFDATNTANASAAIIATAVWFLRVINCRFVGPFSAAAIEIGAGNAQGLEIRGSYIEGANRGIDINGSTTTSPNKGLIIGNTIHTSTECINDAADVMAIVNNNCHTLQAKGSAGAGAIVGNEYLASGNKICASNLANGDYPVLGTL